ncbi:hypothetical protein P280DRAFT_540020 [Massarina eburnea CBS 473.64]|uniref:BTB domain-containing protein n=1 Tax=Massarina eburnea CBS 473.64 TaxID=1395130 RepID=A0A6A6S514_9PLEO|nr:hypothetical protein P280DRAFT_540020 [Massarina eburnea CBS 473.64]
MAPTTNRSRPRISAKGQQFATVVVGKHQDKFIVHEPLLIHYSDFFRAALTNGMKETEEKTVTLAKDNPKVFEIFVHWLYYQRFPNKAHHDDQELVNRYKDPDVLIALYVFGDQYQARQLRNAALSALFYHTLKSDFYLPYESSIRFAYRRLPTDSPLCRLLVDFYCQYAGPEYYRILNDGYPVQFLLAVASRYAELRIWDAEEDLALASYLEPET